MLELGHVLGRLAHGDVDVRQARPRRPRLADRRAPGLGASLGVGEERVVRAAVGRAVAEPADRLDTTGDEDVAFAGLDGMGGHPDGLQRGGAVAVDRRPGHVEPGQEASHPPEVVAGLAGRLSAADDDVLDGLRVELRELLEDGLDDQGGQVVRTAVDERTLHGPADRGPAGGDDHGFGHGCLLGSVRPRRRPGRRVCSYRLVMMRFRPQANGWGRRLAAIDRRL